jgi:hypothetical protein
MDTWRGHFPITHFVLLALRNERNGADAADFSRAEAVLLAACQFWAAAATRQLPDYLGSNPFQFTVTLTGAEAMPLATTASELAPVSVTDGTSNEVDTMVLPVATPMLLWPWVRA